MAGELGLVEDAERALAEAERRFAVWRSRRGRDRRIPDGLWTAAAEVAGRAGITKTARALRLNSAALKRRMESLSPDTADFVEVVLPMGGGGLECHLELEEEGETRRIRLELRGVSQSALESLAIRLWNER